MNDPKVDLKGQGHEVKKLYFRSRLTGLHVMFEVKGQGLRSHGSGSKVTRVEISIKVIMLTGGLTSTSSCFISGFFWGKSVKEFLHT